MQKTCHCPMLNLICRYVLALNISKPFLFTTIEYTDILHHCLCHISLGQCGRGCLCRKVWTQTKILSRTYAILSRIKICRDLRIFWRTLGKKSAFLGQKQCFLGKKCTITWYIFHISLSCHFCSRRKAAKFCHPEVDYFFAYFCLCGHYPQGSI